MNDAQMLRTAAALEPLGIEVLRFDFAYRSRGSRRPDPMPELRARYAAVVDQIRPQVGARALIIRGRPSSGRR